MLPLLLLLGCPAPAEVVDWCAAHPDDCLACEADADCAFGGNPCTEVVYCAHVDQPIAVVQIGCSEALEHPWPPSAACGCVDGACASDR